MKLFIDLPHSLKRRPQAGEYLVTRGAKGYGRAYLILNAREVKRTRRRTQGVRFSLEVDPGYQVSEALRFEPWELHWYPRLKKSTEVTGMPSKNGPKDRNA